MNKADKLKALQEQLAALQKEIADLEKPATGYVLVTQALDDHNWYSVGEVYKVVFEAKTSDEAMYYPLVSNPRLGINIKHCLHITDSVAVAALEETDIQERD